MGGIPQFRQRRAKSCMSRSDAHHGLSGSAGQSLWTERYQKWITGNRVAGVDNAGGGKRAGKGHVHAFLVVGLVDRQAYVGNDDGRRMPLPGPLTASIGSPSWPRTSRGTGEPTGRSGRPDGSSCGSGSMPSKAMPPAARPRSPPSFPLPPRHPADALRDRAHE